MGKVKQEKIKYGEEKEGRGEEQRERETEGRKEGRKEERKEGWEEEKGREKFYSHIE